MNSKIFVNYLNEFVIISILYLNNLNTLYHNDIHINKVIERFFYHNKVNIYFCVFNFLFFIEVILNIDTL